MRSRELGVEGERVAEQFLRKNRYAILARNYRCPLGEIDIIARDGETVVFVEIKARRSERFGTPEEAVTARKRARLGIVAGHYLKTCRLTKFRARFDVVGVRWGQDDSPEITHIPDAFRLSG